MAQPEYGWSAVGARLERGWWHSWGADGGTDGARLERGWSAEGALLVAQTEYGWWSSRSTVGGANGARRERGQSAVRARLGRGQCAVRARLEHGQSAVRARPEGAEWMEKKLPGRGRTGNNLNCCCFPERGSSAGGAGAERISGRKHIFHGLTA